MRRALAPAAALALSACATMPRPAAPPPAAPAALLPGLQYMFGSAESAAISREAWHALTQYAAAETKARPADSVVLADGATLAAPRFVTCGDKPFAAVFDMDETVLLNDGFEYDAATGAPFSDARWQAWERTGAGKAEPVPGAVAGLKALRAMGVTVIINTNRTAVNAAGTAATLADAGLGSVRHGETLFLEGDDATGAHKDGRRARIAARYCVIAMGGDQMGDFSDLFNAGLAPRVRRAAAEAPPIARLWGAGWFVMPNAVYGPALKGGTDDIFPSDMRWAPPAEEK